MTINRLFPFAAIAAAFVLGQDAQKPAQPTAEQMQRMMAAMVPGKEHQKLAKLAGKWDLTLSMWHTPSQKDPVVVKLKGESKMVLGGRFLRMTSKGKAKMMPGMPESDMETITFVGFDRRSNEYTSVGFDTMGTYFVTATGKWDEEMKAIRMAGKDRDPILDFTQTWEFRVRTVSDDEYVWEVIFTDKVHTQGTGKPFKMVEVHAVRQ